MTTPVGVLMAIAVPAFSAAFAAYSICEASVSDAQSDRHGRWRWRGEEAMATRCKAVDKKRLENRSKEKKKDEIGVVS